MVDARFSPLPDDDELLQGRGGVRCGCPDCRGHPESYKTMSPAVRAELEGIDNDLTFASAASFDRAKDRLRRLLERTR